MTLLVPGESSSRAEAHTFAYDVFVVHAAADESFVQGYLLPALGLAPERVLVPKKLCPGRLIIGEIERGVRSSRLTIVVLSFAYMADHWAIFGEQLAAYATVAREAHGQLLPLVLENCELPTHIRALVKLDFRDATREVWQAEIERLLRYFDQAAIPEPDLPCPYPGMRPFTEQDGDRFFGRDAELDDIVRRLRRGERQIYLIGASGSGKSSLIAAGLVPTLARGASGLPSVHVRTLRPGEQPLQRLADALEGNLTAPEAAVEHLLARHAPATSLLLVIDQLEELFALASADERLGFLTTVRALRADPRCMLVFTLRADFYGAFMESALWSDVDGRISRIELGALRDDSLRRIIERPARDLGVFFQPELVSRLLWDVAREPGALPLLQETLFQLWGKRRQRLLTLADYQALGDGTRTGLGFAISEHADAVLRTLTQAHETIALRILLRLVNFGEGRADTRRQQPRAVLRSEGEAPADFDIVLQHLVDNRLVMVTSDNQCSDVHVDLAHEILLHAWPTLVDWIREWRHHEQHRREFEAAAVAWRARGSGNGGLFDPVELAVAFSWRTNAAPQLGHSADLAAFLAASKAAQVRAIRQRWRNVLLVIVPLIAVSTVLLIQIIVERNRADREAREARAAESRAIEQGDGKTLALARFNVDTNPTKAVAMIKPLAGKYWREVRAIAAAARAAGVAWSLPASPHTVSLEMSHDGQRALSVGDDGVVRMYDLVKRTTRTILHLHPSTPPALARFADAERQIVLWHGTTVTIVDAATDKRRDITLPHPIIDLKLVGTTAYWVDDEHKVWQLDLVGTVPTQVPLQEPVTALAPSPDGRWIAFSGEDHLFLYDRMQPDTPSLQVTMVRAQQVDWSDDGENFAALVDHEILDVSMLPVPTIRNRQIEPLCKFVAYRAGHVYVAGPHSVNVLLRDGSPDARTVRLLPGDTISIVEARGKTVMAGASNGLTVITGDGDHVLPLQAARIEGVDASPRSPYVLAQIEGRLLMWNLDDFQPRRMIDEPPDGALFATADQVITGGAGSSVLPPQSIDVATGAAQPLGNWRGLTAVTATSRGQLVALIDRRHHVHLVGPERNPEDLPGQIDIAAFATDDKLVLATLDGAIYVHDVEHHQRTPLGPHHASLLGLAWGHGRHPWVAAAFADGTLWRKNVATGVEAMVTHVPKPDHLSAPDGKLIVGEDGTVLFLHDREVHTWRADGTLGRLAQTPNPLDDFGELGTSQILAIARDTAVYAIARDVPDQVTPLLPSIDGTSAAMSSDTGLLAVIAHGQLDIVDPLGHQQWTLGQARGVTFRVPAISTDGRHVLAQTGHSLVMWSLELPATLDDTVTWLDAMTNAIDDGSARGLGWR